MPTSKCLTTMLPVFPADALYRQLSWLFCVEHAPGGKPTSEVWYLRRTSRPAKRDALAARIVEVSKALEESAVAEYVEFIRNPKRVVWMNFLGGAARGFGFAVGASVLTAFALYILGEVAWSRLPLIGKFIADIVRFVELNRT